MANNSTFEYAKHKKRSLLFIGFAHMLELYDFTLFAVLLPLMVCDFFPSGYYSHSIILGYLAFAVSFLIAPLGSIIWGYIGDKFGSSKIFRFSLLIMAFPSISISCIPTYEQVGIVAPISLLLLRIFQGFSASGEVLGSKIYVLDKVGEKAFVPASYILSACGAVGVMCAVMGGRLASNISWRLPFMFGGGLMFVLLFWRFLNHRDTDEASNKKIQEVVTVLSVVDIIRTNWRNALFGFIVSGCLGVLSYFMHSFVLNVQILHMGRPMELAYAVSECGLVGTICASLCSAFISRKGSNKVYSILMKVLLLCAVLLCPLYSMFVSDIGRYDGRPIIFAMGALLGVFAGIAGVNVILAFSQPQRCRGALLVNSFGVALFGGLTPLLLTWASHYNIMWPGLFASAFFLVSLIVLKMSRLDSKSVIFEQHT